MCETRLTSMKFGSSLRTRSCSGLSSISSRSPCRRDTPPPARRSRARPWRRRSRRRGSGCTGAGPDVLHDERAVSPEPVPAEHLRRQAHPAVEEEHELHRLGAHRRCPAGRARVSPRCDALRVHERRLAGVRTAAASGVTAARAERVLVVEPHGGVAVERRGGVLRRRPTFGRLHVAAQARNRQHQLGVALPAAAGTPRCSMPGARRNARRALITVVSSCSVGAPMQCSTDDRSGDGGVSLRRRVDTGTLVGTHAAGGSVVAFRGIPYAAPPVGPLRFRPPQRPEPWTGERAATASAPSAPQYELPARLAVRRWPRAPERGLPVPQRVGARRAGGRPARPRVAASRRLPVRQRVPPPLRRRAARAAGARRRHGRPSARPPGLPRPPRR